MEIQEFPKRGKVWKPMVGPHRNYGMHIYMSYGSHVTSFIQMT